jgi:hypothetical protein
MIASAPVLGFALLVFTWTTRGLLRAVIRLSPQRIRAQLETAWLAAPPRGRVTRAVSWAFLFGTMIGWLILPLIDPALRDGTWLLGAAIAVTGLCAGVAAWEPETPSAAWGLMLLTEAACLAVASVGDAPVRVVALDAAAVCVALLLALWRSGPPPLPGEAATLGAARRWMTGIAIASGCCWFGLAFPQHGWLVALGVATWCGAVPLHSAVLAAYDRGSPATAMLIVGAVIPAGMVAFLSLPPLGDTAQRVAEIALAIAAVCAWCISLRQTDLRRAIGWWVAAGSCAVLAVPRQEPTRRLMEAGLACGGTMATFLCGAVERERGHRDISRLRGLAARWPGGMGWMVIAGLMITGSPPFAMFAARVLVGTDTWRSAAFLAALGLLGTACLLTTVHRTFLGQPRREEEALDLAGRQKLVLGILCALGLAAAAIGR